MPVRRIRSFAVALVATLAVVLAGVAPAAQAGGEPGHRTWTVWVGMQSRNLAIQGLRFLPGSITINAGDTVDWQAKSMEPHTVTFLKGGHAVKKLPDFNPADLKQVTRRGGHVYTPFRYFNSGILTTVPTGGDAGPLPPVPHYQQYTLRFPHKGTFTYYCLVHGVMMRGTVKVQPAGSEYPFSQEDYTVQAHAKARAMLADGRRLFRVAEHRSGPRLVMAGNDDGVVALMRFVPRTVHVHVGKTVTWKNPGMAAPHTVTFGKEPPPPALFSPSGNPKSFKGGNLNSGLILPGAAFRVTFEKVGTYPYVCALHDSMGMKGKVVVVP